MRELREYLSVFLSKGGLVLQTFRLGKQNFEIRVVYINMSIRRWLFILLRKMVFSIGNKFIHLGLSYIGNVLDFIHWNILYFSDNLFKSIS